MRVLVVTPWYPSSAHSGSGIFNLRDVQLLARQHEVRVLHLIRPDWFRSGEPEETDEFGIIRVPFAVSAPWLWYRTAATIRRELKSADLLHTMAFPALLPFCGISVRHPWVHTEHWSGVKASLAGWKGMARRVLHRLLKKPEIVVAVSNALAVSVAPWCRNPPRTIGNSVPLPPSGSLALACTPGGSIRAVSVGGLVPGKGPLISIEAIIILREQGVDATLRWIGSGPMEAELQKRVDERGAREYIELLGQLERPDLERELLASNIFVLPTFGETFGVAIAEALGCGLPVVTSGEGGHLELLDSFEAWCVSERNAESVAQAILKMRDSGDDKREATARKARELFSEQMRSREYEAAYEAARFAGTEDPLRD